MKEKKTLSLVGLGYVGLPLAVAFAKKGYKVIAFDISKKRIEQLKSGLDVTLETTPEELKSPHLHFTCDKQSLKDATIHIVTVPTPINEASRPDLSMMYSASDTVGRHLKKGDIVVYESTVYPGVTENECVPILEKISGLTYKKDFGVGYSPERINPGDRDHTITRVTKIVAGMDTESCELIAQVYGSF